MTTRADPRMPCAAITTFVIVVLAVLGPAQGQAAATRTTVTAPGSPHGALMTQAEVATSGTDPVERTIEAPPPDSVPEDTTPESTTPEDTTPESTTPEDTTPESTAPEDTTPEDTTPDQSLPSDGVAGANDSTDPVRVVLALVGFAIVLGIAAWWMMRHQGPDDQSYPRPVDEPGEFPHGTI
jgi:hypothetical protein